MASDGCWRSSHHNYAPGKKEEEDGKTKRAHAVFFLKTLSYFRAVRLKKLFFYISLATQLLCENEMRPFNWAHGCPG